MLYCTGLWRDWQEDTKHEPSTEDNRPRMLIKIQACLLVLLGAKQMFAHALEGLCANTALLGVEIQRHP